MIAINVVLLSKNQPNRSTQSENDAGFGGVVGGHFHFYLIANDESDEAFTHFSGNMGEHLVAAGKGYFEHRAGKHRCDDAIDLNHLIFTAVVFFLT